MKFKQKIVSSIMFMFILVLVLQSNVNAAALQSNGNTAATKEIDNWLLQVRQMETLGGTLGLDDTINSSTLKSTAATPNGLDIHMEKNTEYGAMILLSASSYGNPNKITDGQTTTGNSTGVIMKINHEWVSAGVSIATDFIRGMNKRYINIYTQNYVPKRGDAISGTNAWHGSTMNQWGMTSYRGLLMRAWGGSVFSYNGYSWNSGYGIGGDFAYYTKSPTRAVIVMGEGF